jgi:thiamine-phosphate pyrophosphorylase
MDQKILFEIKKFSGAPVFFTDRKKISDFKKTIKNLPKNSIIIVREYDLEKNLREDFAKKIINLARAEDLRILVGKDIFLAKKLKADGVHFSDLDKLPLQFFKKKSFEKKFIFSFACHSKTSFLKSKKLGTDIIFFAPIFPTTSHVGAKAIGLKKFAEIAFKRRGLDYSSPRIYALGGVNSENIKSLRKLPIAGFGAIDLFKKD